MACVLRQRADKRTNESRCVVKFILTRRTIGHEQSRMPDSDPSDRSVAADVLLRQEPDEEEDEEEDEGDGKEDDDDDDEDDDGYSVLPGPADQML